MPNTPGSGRSQQYCDYVIESSPKGSNSSKKNMWSSWEIFIPLYMRTKELCQTGKIQRDMILSWYWWADYTSPSTSWSQSLSVLVLTIFVWKLAYLRQIWLMLSWKARPTTELSKWEYFRGYVVDRYPAEVSEQASVIRDLFRENDANNEINQAEVKKLSDILLLPEIADLLTEFDEAFNIDPNYKIWRPIWSLLE